MTDFAPWTFRDRPLPHLFLRPLSSGRVVIAGTLGDSGRRPDLGYDVSGSAASSEGRRHLAEALNMQADRLVFMEQVHGGRAVTVDESSAGAGLADRRTAIGGADALVTSERGLALVGLSADCPLVALWDDDARWIALAHAGWRGLAAGIIPVAIDALAGHGSAPDGLAAAVGPCIGSCCYEVKGNVIAALVDGARAAPEHVRRNAEGRTHLDLRAVVGYQLAQAGLAPERIVSLPLCTCCGAGRFHSYRRDAVAAGRQALAICLRDE